LTPTVERQNGPQEAKVSPFQFSLGIGGIHVLMLEILMLEILMLEILMLKVLMLEILMPEILMLEIGCS